MRKRRCGGPIASSAPVFRSWRSLRARKVVLTLHIVIQNGASYGNGRKRRSSGRTQLSKGEKNFSSVISGILFRILPASSEYDLPEASGPTDGKVVAAADRDK